MGKWVWFELKSNASASIATAITIVAVVMVLGIIKAANDFQEYSSELSFEELLEKAECQSVPDWELLGHDARLEHFTKTQCKKD